MNDADAAYLERLMDPTRCPLCGQPIVAPLFEPPDTLCCACRAECDQLNGLGDELGEGN